MAKIKFGSIVTNMSGKLGGQVYSHNAAGAYIRNIGTIAVAPTSYQIESQVRLATLVTAWKALTDNQRTSWNAAVINYQKKDVFADVNTPNGYNLFCAVNTTSLIIGEPILEFPPFPEMPEQISDIEITQAATTGVISVNSGLAAVPADENWIIESTAPMAPTINNFKVKLSNIVILPGGTALPAVITADWTAKFGSTVIGLKSGFAITPVNTAARKKGIKVIRTVIWSETV